MDPEGNIYDMQGNFIGTANANELEEMEEDGGPQNLEDQNNMIIWTKVKSKYISSIFNLNVLRSYKAIQIK